MTALTIQQKLHRLADKKKAKILRGFFKTGPGQYGEKDVFLGITVPRLRKFSRDCETLPLIESVRLLRSEIHECRFLALILFIHTYATGDEQLKKKIHNLYIKNIRFVNNWDLVDLSAPKIVGDYLEDKPRHLLYDFTGSDNVWHRRIAIVSTFHFIRKQDFSDTLKISQLLISDSHDLIHKAVGWMLREVGKRDKSVLGAFLSRNNAKMPRTMLRYAIERFPEEERREYLKNRKRNNCRY
jgi:3-methyladenine DNA glycosylase AlkD